MKSKIRRYVSESAIQRNLQKQKIQSKLEVGRSMVTILGLMKSTRSLSKVFACMAETGAEFHCILGQDQESKLDHMQLYSRNKFYLIQSNKMLTLFLFLRRNFSENSVAKQS